MGLADSRLHDLYSADYLQLSCPDLISQEPGTFVRGIKLGGSFHSHGREGWDNIVPNSGVPDRFGGPLFGSLPRLRCGLFGLLFLLMFGFLPPLFLLCGVRTTLGQKK